ncbi:WD40-repeat-containing domain [Trinorchestia longiramus]|nr:WD40-repeat-containing domain [Trinorchestia longiramus]
MEDRLEFLSPRPGGGCAVGCSSLTGRCWSGSVWLYDDPSQAPDVAKSQASYQLQAGVPCALWITRDVLVVGEDGGCVEWLSTAEDPAKFTSVDSICSHTSYISSMSLNSDSTKLVAGGGDGTISILDCERRSKQVFQPAHASACCSVACHATNPHVFASAGLDGNVLVWDTRQDKPASGVHRNSSCPDTAVSWQPNPTGTDLGALLVGNIDGSVRVHCTKSRETLATRQVLNRRVTRLVRSTPDAATVAVVGQQETVAVLHATHDSIQNLYTDSTQHTDMVSDVMWLGPSFLLSCGWDTRVIQHALPSYLDFIWRHLEYFRAKNMPRSRYYTATTTTAATDSVDTSRSRSRHRSRSRDYSRHRSRTRDYSRERSRERRRRLEVPQSSGYSSRHRSRSRQKGIILAAVLCSETRLHSRILSASERVGCQPTNKLLILAGGFTGPS